MTAVYDFVVGKSPQVDPTIAKEHRIGADRAMVVGIALLSHTNRDTGKMWPGRERLAEMTGINERDIRTAIKVLEKSGVITRVEYPLDAQDGPQRFWVPAWDVSGKVLPVSVRGLTVDKALCKAKRIGADRVLLVKLLRKLKWTTKRIAKRLGLSARTLRQALSVLSDAAPEKPRLRRTKAKNKPQLDPSKGQNGRMDPRHEDALTTLVVPISPLRGLTGRTRVEEHPRETGAPMTWSVLDNPNSVATEESQPVRGFGKTKKPNQVRRTRDESTWSGLDSAREFRDRCYRQYQLRPGDTGDVLKISKILGKMRGQFGHDARLEMEVLKLFLGNPRNRRPDRKAPMWKMYLASFNEYYDAAERQIKFDDPTYQTIDERRGVITDEEFQANLDEIPASSPVEDPFRITDANTTALRKSSDQTQIRVRERMAALEARKGAA